MRYTHRYNIGMTVMEATKHFLIGVQDLIHKMNLYLASLSELVICG